jgi:type III secretory pathway lipoprotein EscJ
VKNSFQTEKQGRRRALALHLLPALIVLSTGCKEELRSGLERDEANRIGWLLTQHGVHSEVVQRDGLWSVRVGKGMESRAVNLLARNPLRSAPPIEESTSLIPTRSEELRRSEVRQAARIKEALEGVPGVIEAKVLLALGSGEARRESASVYLLTDGAEVLTEGELKQIVSGGTGIPAERVFVVVKPFSPPRESTPSPSPPALPNEEEGGLLQMSRKFRMPLIGIGATLLLLFLIRRISRAGKSGPDRLRPGGLQ